MNLQNLLLILIGSIWLVGGNVVIYKSLKEQKLPLKNYFNPLIYTKLRVIDWAYLFILIVITFTSFVICHAIGLIK